MKMSRGLACHFLKLLNFVWGLPKWAIFVGKKHISRLEKIRKSDFAPSEKYSSYATALAWPASQTAHKLKLDFLFVKRWVHLYITHTQRTTRFDFFILTLNIAWQSNCTYACRCCLCPTLSSMLILVYFGCTLVFLCLYAVATGHSTGQIVTKQHIVSNTDLLYSDQSKIRTPHSKFQHHTHAACTCNSTAKGWPEILGSAVANTQTSLWCVIQSGVRVCTCVYTDCLGLTATAVHAQYVEHISTDMELYELSDTYR